MRREVIGAAVSLWLALAVVAQTPGGTFAGKVVDERGEPLAGVVAALVRWDEFVDTNELLSAARVVTKEDGAYSFDVEQPDLHYILLACKGRQACRLQLATARRGETLLAPGGKLVGRVRDEQGRGLAGVRVVVESAIGDMFSFQAMVVSGAVSNEKGIFVVPCVPRTGLRVKLEAEGYHGLSRIVSQGSPLDLRLAKAQMVRGTVRDGEGKPLAGMRCNVVSVGSQRAPSSVSSDAQGRFAIAVPSSGPYRIVAHGGAPPYRSFSSRLLRGRPDDVLVENWNPTESKRLAVVKVIDRSTRKPIEAFRMASVWTDLDKLQAVVRYAEGNKKPYRGSADVYEWDGSDDKVRGVLVEADGYAFEVAPLPAEEGGALVVELGPEIVLTGRVLDDETGKPLAGAAVRVLPRGRMSGSGGLAKDAGPLTDANGVFRIRGLRAGEYGVQVHVSDRPASKVTFVTVRAGENEPLTLRAPKRIFVTFDVEGRLPKGPRPQLLVHASGVWGLDDLAGRFDHHVPSPPAIPLSKPGTFRVGPLGRDKVVAQIYVPSRTRTATGTLLALGDVEDGATIQLPKLASVWVRGRIESVRELPTERVMVVAHPIVGRKKSWPGMGMTRPCLAGVRGDGSFELDVPKGRYTFQLVDVETGIAFHTEAEDVEVDDQPLVLRPDVRWLEVARVPAIEGGSVALTSLAISMMRRRDGELPAIFRAGSRSNERETGWVTPYEGESVHRWLVPPGEIEIVAHRACERLQPWSNGWQSKEVDNASVTIGDKDERVVLEIPPLPSDEELMRRK